MLLTGSHKASSPLCLTFGRCLSYRLRLLLPFLLPIILQLMHFIMCRFASLRRRTGATSEELDHLFSRRIVPTKRQSNNYSPRNMVLIFLYQSLPTLFPGEPHSHCQFFHHFTTTCCNLSQDLQPHNDRTSRCGRSNRTS